MFDLNYFDAKNNPCLFIILLILSFTLTISNIADEDKKEKAFPISILVINSLIILAIVLQLFGVKMMSSLIEKNSKLLFWLVFILSLILSIQNVSDSDQENKSLPTITLIINSIVTLIVLYSAINYFSKK